jgi:prepilin-type N-terminal cleavage/methylation domain-containing protein
MYQFRRSRRLAFTLIELLVVIAIIGVLIGLLLPAVQKVREAANRTVCVNNQKQLGLAVHTFVDAHGVLPQAWYYTPNNSGYASGKTIPNISGIGTWQEFLMPFIEQGNLQQQVVSGGPTSQKNVALQTVVKTFVCPSDPSEGKWGYGDNRTRQNGGKPPLGAANYMGNVWVFNPVAPSGLLQSIPDGTSNQVMITEAYQYCNGVTYDGGATGGSYDGPAWGFMVQYMQGGSSNVAMYGGPSSGYNDTNRDYNQGGIPFQVQPTTDGVRETNAEVGNGCVVTCCQTGHSAMPCCLADGSVRLVSGNISTGTWEKANYPYDGAVLASDWNN